MPGAYQLRIRLRRGRSVTVGRLGTFDFRPGWYVYSGSARGGLYQRVGRHLRREKRLHWHVDYLLAAADGVEAFVAPGCEETECDLHTELLARLSDAAVPVPGFGASDCRCHSHLLYRARRPEMALQPRQEGTARVAGWVK